MAWEHFTDWLEPGQILTKAQRDELLDAIEERLKAIDSRWGWSAEMDSVIDSGLNTRLAYAEGGVSAFISDIVFLIDETSQYYSTATDNPASGDYWGNFTVFFQAGADLGYIEDPTSGADQDVILYLLDSGFSQLSPEEYKFWNLLRRAVQLLVLAAPVPTDIKRYQKIPEEEDPQFEDYQDATEELASGTFSSLEAGFFLAPGRLERSEATLFLDETLYASYEVWTLTWCDASTEDASEYQWSWAGGTAQVFGFTTGIAGTRIESLGTKSDSGEITVELSAPIYYPGGPTGNTVASSGDQELHFFFAAPDFTHPYEAIPPP